MLHVDGHTHLQLSHIGIGHTNCSKRYILVCFKEVLGVTLTNCVCRFDINVSKCLPSNLCKEPRPSGAIVPFSRRTRKSRAVFVFPHWLAHVWTSCGVVAQSC